MPFTLHVDFDEIDGTAATRTKSVTIYTTTQVTGPGGKVYDPARVDLTGGTADVTLPSPGDAGVSPADFGFVVRRGNGLGLTKSWNVPGQPTGTTVNLSQFTQTTPLPVTPEDWQLARQEREAAQAAASLAADERVAAQTARQGAEDAEAGAGAAASEAVKREQAGGTAGLTQDGKLYESRIPDRLSDASLSAALVTRAEVRISPGKGAQGATAVNNVSGHPDNAVADDLSAATIVGGGQTGYNNVIGGAPTNVGTALTNVCIEGTNAHYSCISGGYDNVAGGLASAIRGYHCYTAIGSTHGTINGGSYNRITKPGAGTQDYSTISGGTNNEAAGGGSTIGGGLNNLASGTGATIPGGSGNTASGNQSYVPGGSNNLASGTAAGAQGNRAVARETGQSALASTMFASPGDQQTSHLARGAVTTTNVTGTMQVEAAFPLSSAQVYTAHVVARDTTTGDTKAWRVEGVLRRGAAGAVVEVGGAPAPTVLAGDAAAAAWTLATLGGTGTFNLRVTGESDKTIRWVARFVFTEVA